MANKNKIPRLIETKKKLAEKWEHQAEISGSRPAQKVFRHRAKKYRQQIADLEHLLPR
ncbi:MAG: hypothetical protein ACOY3P_25070 [Planctomycetota bacterium]